MTQGKIVGYFKWTAWCGRTSFSKYIVEGESLQPDSRRYYERQEIQKWPLDAIEWELTLDELAKRYPLPADWQTIMAAKT